MESAEVLYHIKDLYITYRGKYVRSGSKTAAYFVPKKDNEYMKLNDTVLLSHINRRYSVSVFSGKTCTKFMCLDVDKDPRINVGLVVSALVSAGVPEDNIILSTSGGKGYHIEIFFESVMKVEYLKRLYLYVLIETGLSTADVEFRPTHGQAIKLPLSVHPRTGNVCWYCNLQSMEPIEDVGYIGTIRKLPVEVVEGVINGLPVPDVTRRVETPHHIGTVDELLVESMPSMMDKGERNRKMVMVGLRCARDGMDVEEIDIVIREWYARQDGTLSPTTGVELDSEVRRIAKWCADFVFSDKSYRRDDDGVSKDDLQWMLSHRERLHRRILFFIMLSSAQNGYYYVSYERVASAVTASVNGVRKAIKCLTDASAISLTSGKVKHRDGKFKRESNRYQVMRSAVVTDSDLTVGAEHLESDFNTVYYSTLYTLLRDELMGYLSKREIQDYNEFKERRNVA